MLSGQSGDTKAAPAMHDGTSVSPRAASPSARLLSLKPLWRFRLDAGKSGTFAFNVPAPQAECDGLARALKMAPVTKCFDTVTVHMGHAIRAASASAVATPPAPHLSTSQTVDTSNPLWGDTQPQVVPDAIGIAGSGTVGAGLVPRASEQNSVGTTVSTVDAVKNVVTYYKNSIISCVTCPPPQCSNCGPDCSSCPYYDTGYAWVEECSGPYGCAAWWAKHEFADRYNGYRVWNDYAQCTNFGGNVQYSVNIDWCGVWNNGGPGPGDQYDYMNSGENITVNGCDKACGNAGHWMRADLDIYGDGWVDGG